MPKTIDYKNYLNENQVKFLTNLDANEARKLSNKEQERQRKIRERSIANRILHILQLIEETAQTGKKELKYFFKLGDNYDQKNVSPEILFSLENKGFKTVICNAFEGLTTIGFTICISWKEEKNDEIENNKKRKIQDEIIPKVQGGFSAFGRLSGN